jgi:adenine/guanine phosphoribosyltransferase-like PRPP-binding protein
MKKVDFKTIMGRLRAAKLPRVDLVVGLESGGTVLAALVGYLLKKPVVFMGINYRDETNAPQHARPVLLKPFPRFKKKLRVLIVDDVSVTGQTLELARKMLKPCSARTFVLKGQADYVLFPKIKECVKWPWRP